MSVTAARVRRKLLMTGATQMQISDATGIPQTTISRVIRGEGMPRVDIADKLEAFADEQLEIAARARRAEQRLSETQAQ